LSRLALKVGKGGGISPDNKYMKKQNTKFKKKDRIEERQTHMKPPEAMLL
jgi:hypothetical protein